MKSGRISPVRLLRAYLWWGAGAFFLFGGFAALVLLNLLRNGPDLLLLFSALISGFFWLGATVISRHVYVMTKTSLRQGTAVWEFLATQLSFPLFPFLYLSLRRRVLEAERDQQTQE